MNSTPASSSAASQHAREPWHRPVRDFPGLVHLAPPINHPDDPLQAVIESFSRDPGANAIFIVDAEDHLVGCIREQALDADLVTLILPQHLWPAVREMDTRDLLRAARGPRRTAREAMVGVRSITPQTPLIEAVGVMTRAQQPTAPLVDADGRLLGYVRLFEVLAHFLRQESGGV
jgi:CBS-domain-containing membrane protein